MTGFEIVKDDKDKGFDLLPISSITVAKGDLLMLAVGATTWILATAAAEHWQRKAIAQEAATTSDSFVKAVELDGSELVKAGSTNNSNAAHNGDRMLLTDEDQVNNTGTDSTAEEAGFLQTGVVGAAADKTILGHVLVGSGVNPDAA